MIGYISYWLEFWARYKQTDQDDNLTKEDKFQYIIQATIPKSRVRKVIDSYPPVSNNYPRVIEGLKFRFSQKDFMMR